MASKCIGRQITINNSVKFFHVNQFRPVVKVLLLPLTRDQNQRNLTKEYIPSTAIAAEQTRNRFFNLFSDLLAASFSLSLYWIISTKRYNPRKLADDAITAIIEANM